MKKGLIIMMLLLLSAFGCARSRFNPTMSSVSGTYEGQYGGGSEVFVFMPNGTFTQHFVKAGQTVYKNQGTWWIDSQKVEFKNFVSALSDAGNKSLKPTHYTFAEGALNATGDSIFFNEDTDVFVQKQ